MNAPVREPSIADYAAIGDCRTLALVSRFGGIDWCCVPDFSSPSVFAALLDRERGGSFTLTPRGLRQARQQYLPRSNVLRTRMECEGGVLELTDFMTLPAARAHGAPAQEIVRIAECVAGSVELALLFQPRPDYARAKPQLARLGERHWRCATPPGDLALRTSFTPQAAEDGAALHARVAMRAGDTHAAILDWPATPDVAAQASATVMADAAGTPEDAPLPQAARARLVRTLAHWQAWADQCTYSGVHADAVLRSALALKLLTHASTGAVVAAGTTSLPESETGERNWDYRFCWLRDSSLVFRAFTELGYSRESGDFLQWLLHATHRTRPRLQVVYDMYGGHELHEQVLPNLRGYHGIGPVRIGNAASGQDQHDVYGEVIATAHEWARRGGHLGPAERALVAQFAQMACRVWRAPDHGIWEIRSAPRHNTHSKMMCWVALDCALELHAMQPLPVDPAALARERDAIRADIEANAHGAGGAYVGYYGGSEPDASLLLMPRMKYVAPNDPRMLATTAQIQRELSQHGLLYRYPPNAQYDGVAGGEHLFAICSFWLVDCLARQQRVDEAEALFERLLSLATETGLYAEELDVRTGAPVANFPQAFSHVGLITAALSLQAARRA